MPGAILRLPQQKLQEIERCCESLWCVTKTCKPLDAGFPTKPGELTFGVATSGLGDGPHRIRNGLAGLRLGQKLAIADKFEELRGLRRTLGDESRHFLAPAMIEHKLDASLDALIKRLARRVETDLQSGVALQGPAASSMQLTQGLPRQQTHLHRTHELLAIIWRDAFGSGGIEATKYLVQVYAAALCAGCIEPRTQPVRARGRIGQTLHERAKIQPGSDGENR